MKTLSFTTVIILLLLPFKLSAGEEPDTSAANRYYNQGETFHQQAAYDSALFYYSKAAALYQSAKVWEPYTLCLRQSGTALRNLRRYPEAAKTFGEAIAAGVRHLGPDHPLVAAAHNGLGGVYYYTGNFEKALGSCSAALAIRIKSLGPEHPDVAHSHLSLAGIYYAMSDFEQTAVHYQKALPILVKIHGAESAETADVNFYLGTVYTHLYQFDKALIHYQTALDIRLKFFGATHPDVAATYSAIASHYEAQYLFDPALDYYRKALDVQIRISGEQHTDVAALYYKIGEIYFYRQQEYSKALEHYRKALAIRNQALHPEHPLIAVCYKNIGDIFFTTGEHDSALVHARHLLGIRRKTHKGKHPDLTDSYNRIGDLFFLKAGYDSALVYYRMAYESDDQPSFRDIAKVCRYKGDAFGRSAEYDSASVYMKKAAELYLKEKYFYEFTQCFASLDSIAMRSANQKRPTIDGFFLKLDANAAAVISGIGEIYEETENDDKALACYMKALAIQRKLFKPNHPELLKTTGRIGHIYSLQKKFDAALEYLQTAYNGLIKSSRLVTNEAFRIRSVIAGIYAAQGDTYRSNRFHDSAAFCYAKAAEIHKEQKRWQEFVDSMNKLDSCIAIKPTAMDTSAYRRLARFDKADSLTAVACTRIGTIYFYLEMYDKALRYYRQALDIRQKLFGPDHPDVAWSYYQTGNVYLGMGDHERALACYRKSHEIRMASEESEHTGFYKHIGDVYRDKAGYENALENYLKLIEARKRSLGVEHPELAKPYEQIAALYESAGDYENAIHYYLLSLGINKKTHGGESHEAAASHNLCAIAFYRKGDSEKALEHHQKALNIRIKIFGAGHSSVSQSCNNMGLVFSSMGDYDKALEFFLKPLSSPQETHQKATSFYNIGDMYFMKGDYDKALDYHIQSLTLSMGHLGPDHPFVAESYQSIGRVFEKKGESDKAIDYYMKSMDLFSRAMGEKSLAMAAACQNTGSAYQSKGNYPKALDYFQNALKIRLNTTGFAHPGTAVTYYQIGDTYRKMNNPDSALMYYQSALRAVVEDYDNTDHLDNPDLNLKTRSETVLLCILKNKSLALFENFRKTDDRKYLESALSASELAVRLIDKIRSGFLSESSKLFLGEQSYDIFETGVCAAHRMQAITGEEKYKDLAFKFAEKSKAGVLLESLNDARAKSYAGIPDSVLAYEKSLRNELIAYDKHLADETGKGKEADQQRLQVFRNRVFELKRKYEDHVKRLERDYPSYFTLKYKTITASAGDIQKSLPGKAIALIEYFMSADSLYIFSVTKKKFGLTVVPKDSLFEERIRLMRNLLVHGKTSEWRLYAETSHDLYKTLIRPLTLSTDIRHLVIIPDGALHLIPFESLVTRPVRGRERGFENLKYLIQEYSVSYSYSAALYLESLNKTRSGAAKEYIGFAPVFSEESGAGTVTRPHAIFLADSAGTTRRLTGRNTIAAIPGTRDEILSVYGGFSAKKKPAAVYTYLRANEDNLKKERLSDYRYIHFATHGFVNEDKPQYSGIILAQDSSADEDGVLYAGEVYGLQLDAESVILSACETGLGRQVRGEGIIGLTRGFLYAGARSVVVSLWTVADESTSRLMQDYFRRLAKDNKSQNDQAKHLRETKIKMTQDRKYAHPFFWSPFVLIGK